MQYKALICDVDGTLIPNRRDGMPSKKVRDAIKKASYSLHVGVATSRPLCDVEHIIKHLELSGPSIINGGAEIYDATKKKVLSEHVVPQEELKVIIPLLHSLRKKVFINDGEKDWLLGESNQHHILQLYVEALEKKAADMFIHQALRQTKLSIHTVPSWTIGKYDIVITHALATKQYGIFEVAKILQIHTHEIIGVGDGNNDFPLLMACGLKVAMGNAVDELKEIADYVAPPVERDGVVDVIEKYISHE